MSAGREKRWIHVGFSWPDNGSEIRFQAVFDKATDWIKYSKNGYFLYTALDLDTWSDRIKEIPGMAEESIFISEFDPIESSGLLPQWIWDRLYKQAGSRR